MSRARDDRKAIHAYLTDEAHDALYRFARLNGPTVSAILQAWCNELAEEMADDGPEIRQDLVRAARAIDAERRMRGED